jgi:hypothetical protein
VPKALDADETEILNIAKECLAAADNLTAKLEEIRGNGTSYRAGLTSAVKKLWNKREIEELESMLSAHRDNLELRLLQRNWYVNITHGFQIQNRNFVPWHLALFMETQEEDCTTRELSNLNLQTSYFFSLQDADRGIIH